jgi:hypothetical protein
MKKDGRNFLLLDTGNLLLRKVPQTETKRKDALLRIDLLIQSYNEMGYEVVNVGEKDLMMGVKFLSEVGQKAKFSFISANLTDPKNGKPIFKPYMIKDIAGLKIGIVGVLDDQYNPTLQVKDPGLNILEPFSTIKTILKGLKEYCDFIVVLSQLGESKDRKLVREIQEINLILGGGGESKRGVVERLNGTSIYRLEPRGGYLGRVDYSLTETKKPIQFFISSERDQIEKRLERVISHSLQIKTNIEKSEKKDEIKIKELKFLESKQKELEKVLLALEDKNFYKHTAIPVQLAVADDPKIIKALETYRVESAKLYKPKVAFEVGKEWSEKDMFAQIPKASPFVGAISCKRCHEINYKNWLKTKHAKASQTIASSPKYAQEECLMCHSTGYGKIGEYAIVADIPFYLQGVQCEVCHGEGRGHPEKRKMERKVTLGTCRNCHTKDQSPTFNYMAFLEKISCKITK